MGLPLVQDVVWNGSGRGNGSLRGRGGEVQHRDLLASLGIFVSNGSLPTIILPLEIIVLPLEILKSMNLKSLIISKRHTV